MKLTTLAIAGALALTGASASFAQPAASAPAEQRQMRMQRPDPAQMAERRAEHLRAALQLRPEQDAALRAFIGAQQPQRGARDRMRGERQAMGQMTTPQRLEQARARMGERQAAFERRAAATLRFYAQLSPSQQKAFDAMKPGGGHMKRGGGMGHGRG